MDNRRVAAREFALRWKNKGSEEKQTQAFWEDLLENVFEISRPYNFIETQRRVKVNNHIRKIDIYIPHSKVLIEQKDSSISLDHSGYLGTAFEQAQLYEQGLNLSDKPKWIITCNFQEFRIYDRDHLDNPPEIIKLENLEKEYNKLSFLENSKIKEIVKQEDASIKAAELIVSIYNELKSQFKDPDNERSLNSLNIICVRIAFLMYSKSVGIIKEETLNRLLIDLKNNPGEFRSHLIKIFKILDQNYDNRDPYLDDLFKQLPWVNGGLFADEKIEVPYFTPEAIKTFIKAYHLNWSDISPAIFGAAFESTVNPETRRSLGMHYTSSENIHKVIDPLFLNGLKDEFTQAVNRPISGGARNKALRKFIDKLASLKFLDPACGSGNFLTETYICLRKLENKALKELLKDPQIRFNVTGDLIKVKITQFYGIEINSFAVAVANTSLWIAELKMFQETLEIVNEGIEPFPLEKYENIKLGNALTINWNDILSSKECNYIMSNPPFVGYYLQSPSQKKEIKKLFHNIKGAGMLDYVCGWYAKAADYMKGTDIEAAFVSTNSICQGVSVGILWGFLFKLGIIINFARQTFIWANETKFSAHVNCVILGISYINKPEKEIYSDDGLFKVKQINGYLQNAPNIAIKSKRTPMCSSSKMIKGNMPIDGGYLILSDKEYREYIQKEPQGKKFLKKYLMGDDLINNKFRWCFWLVDVEPNEIRRCPILLNKIKKVKEFRLKSSREQTRKGAKTPYLFNEIRQPVHNFIAIPETSSERRDYIPIDYLTPDTIVGNSIFEIQDATIYHFGVLTSNVHNSWMRTVAGRLEMRYRYSNTLVYNNFPWPKPSSSQEESIEETAELILSTRNLYPHSSLADLYDPDLMPLDLKKAHEDNDKVVMDAYGFDYNMSENDVVTELMKIYQTQVALPQN